MKKKIAALLLVCLAAFGLLPGLARAEEQPENWQELDTAQVQYLLNGIADFSIERNIVFICYGSGNSSVGTAIKPWVTSSSGFLIYAYNQGVSGIEDALNALFDNNMTVADARLPIVVTYNKQTQNHTVNDNVINPSDVPGVCTGLRTIMSANGVKTSEMVDFQPNNPDKPDKPDNPAPDKLVYPTMGIDEFEWEVLRLVNQYRMRGGVAPLSVFAELAKVSDIRAQELPAYLLHTRPNGGGYETVFTGSGAEVPIAHWTTHAENIAAGQTSPDDVMYSWLHSNGHRENIEQANKLHLGVGYYYNENNDIKGFRHYWAQNFLADNRLCSFYDMRLSAYSVSGRKGVELEELLKAANIEVTVTCNAHGLCSMPLIAGMCSVQNGGAYDSNATVDQILQVEYLGAKNTLTVKAYNTEPEEKPTEKVKLTLNSDNGNIGGTNQAVMSVEVIKGQAYKLPLANKSGFTLQYWSDGVNSYKANVAYVVAHDTELIAVWQKNSGSSSGGGGSHRPNNPNKVQQPEQPMKPAEPNKPAEPEKPGNSLKLAAAELDAAEAEVTAKYVDVQQMDWYVRPVAYMHKLGLMNGMRENQFAPSAKMTRAMLVTMLYRLESNGSSATAGSWDGGSDNKAAGQFSDVPSALWYSDAVNWSASVGVVNGMENGKFAPDNNISREHLAVMLYRYAQYKGYDVSVRGDLDAFLDGKTTSAWAQEPMQWAVGCGLLNGLGEGLIVPYKEADRAEVATMVMRFCENVVK